MNPFKTYKLINLVLAAFNLIVLFMPKKPIHGVSTNAAGGLVFISLFFLGLLLAHVILMAIALYLRKVTLLKIMAFAMIPVSLLFGYFFLSF